MVGAVKDDRTLQLWRCGMSREGSQSVGWVEGIPPGRWIIEYLPRNPTTCLLRMIMKISTQSRLIIIFVLMIALIGCVINSRVPFPNSQIVYQTGSLDNPKVGFVDADGSNHEFISINTYVAKPLWSVTGNTLYVIARRESVLSGYPSIWNQGHRIKSCQEWWATDVMGGVIEAKQATGID